MGPWASCGVPLTPRLGLQPSVPHSQSALTTIGFVQLSNFYRFKTIF